MLMALLSGIAAAVLITIRQLPDELVVHQSGKAQLNTFLPVSVEISDCHSDSAKAKILGMVGVKEVGIRTEKPKKVILAGTLFGLRMYSDGVMVVGLSDFQSGGRSVNPAKDSGISQGEIIRSANGRRIFTNVEFAKAVMNSNGTLPLELVGKDGHSRSVTITPMKSDTDDCLKTGMWVRDSAAGIGTLSYIDPETEEFGGLGHGSHMRRTGNARKQHHLRNLRNVYRCAAGTKNN